jgi:2-oxoglutarate dehydrogenase E2 component (dihydrolipoamide succinyltransferase)
MATDIVVPTLGESVSEATVAQWLKKPGEAVGVDEPLVELETDKVTLEVNAAEAGVLSEILVEAGGNVEVGAVLGRIGEASGAPAPVPETSAPETPAPEATTPSKPEAVATPAPAPPAGNGAGEALDLVVPALGESVSEAMVARWLKSEGEAVAADEPLVELETDKVTLEVNAPTAGVLFKIAAAEGATVEVGAHLGVVLAGAGASAAPVPAAAPAEVPTEAPAAATPSAAGGEDSVTARLRPDLAPRTEGKITKANLLSFLEESTYGKLGPAVRKLVEEKGLDPAVIPASGPDGRVTKGDVLDFLEGKTQPLAPPSAPPAARAPAPAAVPSVAKGPREERVKMSKLRQTVARRLKEAQNTAAMLTTFNEIDMSATMALRKLYRESFEKKHGVRLGFMSFFTKAVVAALQEIQGVNARLEGDEIVYNKFFDIGMAVSTPTGLMVPVVRDCEAKSFAEIEQSLADLAAKGREGKITLEEMTGGSFTITNGGVFGSLLSTPILNMPQSGILGLHKIEPRPMAIDGQVVVRPMMYVALSYDHRIVDGREAVTFLVRIKEAIEDPQRLLLQV